MASPYSLGEECIGTSLETWVGLEVYQNPNPEALKQCNCFFKSECKEVLYYYHSDHVGSSTFLSDAYGKSYEFMLYLPYGEEMARQKVAGWATPYTFTGKEKDDLTGLQYFGARYYDSRISIWYGVDPMAEKYPNLSSYIYTGNNPINRFDPNGMDWYTDNESQKYQFFEGNGERKGFTHQFSEGYLGFNDESGLRSYGNADGSTSHYGPIELQAAEVTDKTPGNYNNSAAYKVLGELASGNNNGPDNPYLPIQGPDAISIQFNASASGIFMESGFSGGVAMSTNEFGVFGGTSASAGYSFPGLGISIQLNFHNRTDSSLPNVLDYIGGADAGGSIGIGFIGGYSRSVQIQDRSITKSPGFHSYSIGLGLFGGQTLGARTSISKTRIKTF
jgi:RHS repeat-associated protein